MESFVYEGSSLKYVLHGEGMITMEGTPQYQYHVKDHLGNNRLTINSSGTIVDQAAFYPFGMLMTGKFSGGINNKYLYNGKELQDDELAGVNLDWYDYGARFYDASLGRFHTIDPLAEKYSFQSPFVYAANNPIRYIDWMGMGPDDRGKDIWDAPALWSNISIDWSFWGASLGGQLGPLKGEAEVSAVKVEGKVEKKGDDIKVEGKGTIGNVKLSGGVNNVIEGSATGSLAEGTASISSDGPQVNGKLITGDLEVSNNTSQSSYKTSGSVLPNESKTEQKNLPVGSNVDNFNLEMKGKIGPVNVSVGGNPVVTGAKSSMIVGSHAKQATGHAPPMPIFILFNAIFGGGDK